MSFFDSFQKPGNDDDEYRTLEGSFHGMNVSVDQKRNTTESSLKDGFKVPDIVTYSLHITFEGQEVLSNHTDVPMHLKNHSSYEDIAIIAEECVKAQFGHTALAGRSVHFRSGECTIICKNNDKSICDRHTKCLSNLANWEDICTVIASLSKSSRSQDIHLDIFREYYGLLVQEVDEEGFEEGFAKAKVSEIYDLMKTTFDGKRYLSRLDVLRVASKDMVRETINEDPTIQPEEKEPFIQLVCERAPKLLTMCVLARMQMSCLKLLLEKGQDDNTNPLKEERRCHESCSLDFSNLLWGYRALNAATFFRPGIHEKFSRGTVLPIQYYPEVGDPTISRAQGTSGAADTDFEYDEENEGSNKNKAFRGFGDFTRVHRVRLDPAHHNLTKDKNAAFALKYFGDRPHRTEANFQKEMDFLNELLRHPKEHMDLHLATWTQDGKYYMLSPYAECNLRQYMERHTFSSSNKKNVLWLLAQILGLSGALRGIHHPSSPPETSTNLAPGEDVQMPEWHHDLKPENIYYFKGLAFNAGTFKIANLGSSILHVYRSWTSPRRTRSPKGTSTYQPPEIAKEGATSQPHDVWSMGCIFLEVLIWAVSDCGVVDNFKRSREGKTFPDDTNPYAPMDDAFWQIDSHGTIHLRDSVRKMLGDLGKELENRDLKPLQEVLGLVHRMLDTNSETRLTALDLWDALSCIDSRTKGDFGIYEDDSLLDRNTFGMT